MPSRRYTPTWQRDVTLVDGSPARFRWLRPTDAAKLREGFAQLSPETVRLRFHGARSALGDSELRYLTECDQEHHLALCAVSLDAAGDELRGLAVARCVRLADEPNVAESAVVVADAAQRQGLGRRLLVHLARAAMERGIDTFRCEVLEENEGMRALLTSLAPAVIVRDADVLDLDARALVDGHAQAEAPRVLALDVPLSEEGRRGPGAFSTAALAGLLRLMAARALRPLNRLLSSLGADP